MNPSVKKAVSGRAMRVATTFTGAAACAFAFAPTALAGTHQPAAQPGHQPRQVRVDNRMMPMITSLSFSLSGGVYLSSAASIKNANCRGTNQSHWLHLGSVSGTTKRVTCFGFKGTVTYLNPFKISQECGGNNKGWIKSNGGDKITYGTGTTYRKIGTTFIKSVHISKWTGSDKCPLFP
jgi:hypothetical protein